MSILFDDGDEVDLNYILRRSYPKLKPLVLLWSTLRHIYCHITAYIIRLSIAGSIA